ncbi:MAG: hypothetical protein IKE93_00420 [Erysipelotrichaceae bacterium]|nr:hypothetical protein [Erysipelotrichaceae bacterium]
MNQNNNLPISEVMESLNTVQRNALTIEKPVGHVITMSGRNVHEQTVGAILADEQLNILDKIELINHENEAYEFRQEANTVRVIRMTEAQTESTERIVNIIGENVGLFLLGFLLGRYGHQIYRGKATAKVKM